MSFSYNVCSTHSRFQWLKPMRSMLLSNLDHIFAGISLQTAISFQCHEPYYNKETQPMYILSKGGGSFTYITNLSMFLEYPKSLHTRKSSTRPNCVYESETQGISIVSPIYLGFLVEAKKWLSNLRWRYLCSLLSPLCRILFAFTVKSSNLLRLMQISNHYIPILWIILSPLLILPALWRAFSRGVIVWKPRQIIVSPLRSQSQVPWV